MDSFAGSWRSWTLSLTKGILSMWRSVVLPMMMYGTEIYAPSKGALSQMGKVQCWAGRTILAAAPSTSNKIIYSEMGWIPPKQMAAKYLIMFTGRVMRGQCAITQKLMHQAQQYDIKWSKLVNSTYQMCNCPYVDGSKWPEWQEIVHKLVQTWGQNDIAKENKWGSVLAQEYSKYCYGFEDVHEIIKYGGKACTSLLRLRSHSLPIAMVTGRREGHIPRYQRICPKCKLEPEDTFHFLLRCPATQQTRDKLYAQLEKGLLSLAIKSKTREMVLYGITNSEIRRFMAMGTFPPTWGMLGYLQPIIVKWAIQMTQQLWQTRQK